MQNDPEGPSPRPLEPWRKGADMLPRRYAMGDKRVCFPVSDWIAVRGAH
jgi:hypothetical protein